MDRVLQLLGETALIRLRGAESVELHVAVV